MHADQSSNSDLKSQESSKWLICKDTESRELCACLMMNRLCQPTEYLYDEVDGASEQGPSDDLAVPGPDSAPEYHGKTCN